MKKITLLTLGMTLSIFTATADAKPVTLKMKNCGGDDIRTISTNCKNQAAGFTLRYSMQPYRDYDSNLRVFNPTNRTILLYRVNFYDGDNEECDLYGWNPDGEPVEPKSYYNIQIENCKPERILKYVFTVGNKRYVY